MYNWEKDKVFINQSYRVSADLVNQLVQKLKKENIEVGMRIAGSKSRNMILRNGKAGIDYDFNLEIMRTPSWDGRFIKNKVMDVFDEVLSIYELPDCEDSTSVISTKPMVLPGMNVDKTSFKIDICIVRRKQNLYGCSLERLIHNKTGNQAGHTYSWEIAYENDALFEQRVNQLKDANKWIEVRECYKDKRNMYLRRNDHDHPAYVCYIEAVNEVHYKYFCCGNSVQSNVEYIRYLL